MARILQPLVVGGGWGLGLGAAATAATILSPMLRPLARRALNSYFTATTRARARTRDAMNSLEDLYEGAGGRGSGRQ